MSRRNDGEEFPWDSNIGNLKVNVAATAYDLRTDLDELLLEAAHGPNFGRPGRCQSA
jgi:hypothetical protein